MKVLMRLRVLVWATAAALGVRRRLRAHGLADAGVRPAPRVGAHYERDVERVLAALRVRCLVRGLVLQRYLHDQGRSHVLVLGASSPRRGFSAHAWLDRPGEDDKGHLELLRLPVPS